MAAKNNKTGTKKKALAKKTLAVKKASPKKNSALKAKRNRGSVVKIAETPKTENKPVMDPATPKKKIPAKYFYLSALIIALGGLLYLGKGLIVAAMVNGRPITRYELIHQLEKESGKQTLDTMVTKSLILQEAQKRNVTVSNDEINTEIDKIRESLKSQNTTLEDALAMQGQDMSTLRESIMLQKMIEKMFGTDVQVSDADIQKYYDDNKDYFSGKKLDEVKNDIKDQLVQQKISDNYRNWISQAKTNAKVRYFVNL